MHKYKIGKMHQSWENNIKDNAITGRKLTKFEKMVRL